jgi:hypothetical protein
VASVHKIIVQKLDRLTRSVKDLSAILELVTQYDVALLSVSEHIDTTSASGRLLLNLLGTVAAWERETIGERTAAALARKRACRHVYGRVPYGFRSVETRLVPDQRAIGGLELIRAMHGAGASLRQVCQPRYKNNASSRLGAKHGTRPASVRSCEAKPIGKGCGKRLKYSNRVTRFFLESWRHLDVLTASRVEKFAGYNR